MRRTPYAFTRFDMLALLAAMALLGAVAVPVFAGRGDIDRAVCSNNLRLIGRGIQTFAMDHEQRAQWWTTLWDGGTYFVPKAGNAWFELMSLSNAVPAPQIFVCPSEMSSNPSRRPAQSFDDFRSLREQAVSYSINVHAGRPPENEWMLSDRNLQFDSGPTLCGLSGFNNAYAVNASSNTSNLAWTNNVHGEAGHVLWFDGRVEFTSTPQLRSLVLKNDGDGVSAHVIPAR